MLCVAKSEGRTETRKLQRVVLEIIVVLRSSTSLDDLIGIPQSTISAIENNRLNLGVERAKVIARALKVHPAVFVFPSRDVRRASAA